MRIARRVYHWIVDHCDECGYRFLWRQHRYSYPSTDRIWHRQCMELNHVITQRDDAEAVILGMADSDADWRVEYRLRARREVFRPQRKG